MKHLRWSVFVLALAAVVPAWAQPFVLAQTRVEIVSNPVATHLPVRVALATAEGFDLNDLSVVSDSPWVSGVVLPGEAVLELRFATQGLVARTSSATLALAGGGHESQLAVEATTSLLNIVGMQADPLRPVVYALQQDGVARGGLLVFDPVDEAGSGFLTVGGKPTDLAISPDGQEAIVLSSASQQIHVIDLVGRRVTQVINLPTYTEWGIADSAGRLAYGSGNLIYYSDGAWESNIHVLNRSTGAVLQSKPIGVGDFTMLPDGSALVGWYRYGWHAGSTGSGIWRVPLQPDGLMGQKEQPTTGPVMNRDPLNTPVIVTPDGKTLFAKQFAFDPAAFPQADVAFAGPVYAASTYGEVVATASGLYDYATGNQLIDLPVDSQVQAITSDYTRLVYYDSAQRELRVVEIIDQLLGVDFGGGSIFPADNAAVVPPGELRWTDLPGVSAYRVYLGTDEAAVAAATPESETYLATVAESRLALASRLVTNTTHFWRVDVVVGAELIRGVVRKFFVSAIAPAVRRLEAATVQAHRNLLTHVPLAGEEDGLAWSVTANVDWIQFAETEGETPATLTVIMDASALTAGVHAAEITLNHADGATVLPVLLTVDALKLTHIRSAPGSAIAYAISEDSTQAVSRAHLLEIDSESEAILRSVPVGSSVTDVAIHGPENRVYVTNWRPGLILAVDRDSFTPVRTYGFKPWTSVGYGEGDPYRVAVAGFGRIVVEEYDQWIDIRLVDTLTGETLNRTSAREGGGVSTAGGRYYYHGDNNSSGAELIRFDLLGDVFTRLAAKRVSYSSYYGSRTVVASEDGKRVFWNGGVFSANLTEEWNTSEEVYSTNADGSLAFGRTKIFDVARRQVAYAMPAETTVSAFNSTSGKLMVQQGDRIVFYALGEGVPLTAPELSGLATGHTTVDLEWTDRSLEASLTLQYRQADAVDWSMLANLNANVVRYTANGLKAETTYEFRVRANTADDSSAWSNVVTVTTLIAPPARPSITELSRQPGEAVLIRWSEGGPVDRVIIERRGQMESDWTVIATVSHPTGGSFVDADAKTANTYYYYRLKSFRGNQSSAYSSESYVYFPPLSAPSGGSLPSSQTVDEGAWFARSVSISGNPYPEIRWYRNGVRLTNQTSNILRIENIDVLQSGTYHYELTNSQGSYVSNSMVVTVQPATNPILGRHNYLRHGYVAGGRVRITNTFNYVGNVASLGWQVLLPTGWSFVADDTTAAVASIVPADGQTGYLEWAWIDAPPSGTTFVYTLAAPVDASGPVELAGLVLGTKNNVGLQAMLQPDPLRVPEIPWNHSADTDLDGRLSLSELLRVIELYNTRNGTNRTGRYQTSESTTDRYATAPGVPADATVDLPDFHAADFDRDATISLPELLRVIELYNTRRGTARTGGYRHSPGTDDGFAPDPERDFSQTAGGL